MPQIYDENMDITIYKSGFRNTDEMTGDLIQIKIPGNKMLNILFRNGKFIITTNKNSCTITSNNEHTFQLTIGD